MARFLLRADISAMEIGFWRAAMAGVLFAIHASVQRPPLVATRDLPAVIAFALVGVTLFYFAFFRAVQEGGAVVAAILLYTAPVWVAVAGPVLLAERLTARKVVAIALSVAGVFLVAAGSGDAIRLGPPSAAVFWGLAAGLCYASYYIFGKRYFARYAPAAVFAVAMPVGALAMLPMVDFMARTAWAWALLVFIAVVPTYGAYLLYAAGLARIDATRAATIATLEPIVAAMLAFVVWGEALRPSTLVGAALVIGALLLTLAEAPAERAGV